MLSCYRCNSGDIVKNGFMEGQQRYKCKECDYNFVNKPRRGHGMPMMAFSAWLYLNGLPQRKIAEMIGVSSVAISKWVKEFDITRKSGFLRRSRVITVVSPKDIEVFVKGEKLKSKGGQILVALQDSSLPKDSGIIINVNEEQDVETDS
jgi:transposase-like protein